MTTISPTSGSHIGGTTVTIIGTGFTNVQKVFFGSAAAASFTIVSPTEIMAVTPAESAATIDVKVQTAGGTSAAVTGDKYTFV